MSSAPSFELTRIVEDVGGLKEKVKNLEHELEAAKQENKGWVGRWGLYLGVLASLVAIPTATKHAIDSWYQHASVKIQEADDLTLTLDPGRNVVVFSFPVTASNNGTGPGYVAGGNAHLESMPPSPPVTPMDVAGDNVKLYDESRSPQNRPVYVAVGGSPRLLTAYLDFGPNGMSVPGWYRLRVTLNNEQSRPLLPKPIAFCFNVTPGQIEHLRLRPIEQTYSLCQQ